MHRPSHLCVLIVAFLSRSARIDAAWPLLPDSSLVVTEIIYQPEASGTFLGSPSILRLANGTVLVSHDWFGSTGGSGTAAMYPQTRAEVLSAPAGGGAFAAVGAGVGLYWATLFSRPGDAAAYLMGVSSSDGARAAVTIARSADGGATWLPSPAAVLRSSATSAYSTGPTPVLLWAGRLWRAYEHNLGAWASGYAAVVASAAADAPDLTAAAAWTFSGELPFDAVRPLVPPAWANATGGYAVEPSFGWLEGNAVQPEDPADAGVYIMLRVQAGPTANKAALLYLAGPVATPAFRAWVDFPGGQTKFTVRRDAQSGLYVTLANTVTDSAAAVTLPPACGPVALPADAPPLPCCGFLRDCPTGASEATCLWCHANARNNLTLNVAPRAAGPWRAVATVLADDTGFPAYLTELQTGFQYADWQFDAEGGDDLLASVRAGYRGANNYHNANRHLLKRIANWRALVPADVLQEAAAVRREFALK